MRLQPFKTKFTPFFKIDWGKKYPPAKYPTRPKKEVHTFDIKEFVKNQKKKKLLEMMNSAEDGDKQGGMALPGMGSFPGIPGLPGLPGMGSMPSANMAEKPDKVPTSIKPTSHKSGNDVEIPDFLTRNKPSDSGSSVPDFDTFKRQMEENTFNPFEPIKSDISDTKVASPSPKTEETSDSYDDDLGFDVDELVRKIDAKIAELEEEEKRQNETKEKAEEKAPAETSSAPIIENSKEVVSEPQQPINSINNIYDNTDKVVKENNSTPVPNINLDDGDDDDDFFDDFFDN